MYWGCVCGASILLDSEKYLNWPWNENHTIHCNYQNLKARHQDTITTKTEEEEPDFHCDRQRDRWTKRPKRAASNRKLCGNHAGTCHASLVLDEEVKLATTEETKSGGEDKCPGADQRRVDSPRLLFSLVLFSCSCSNRTVNNNNNNNSRMKSWLTSPSRASWLVKDMFWPSHWLLW